MEHTLEHRIRQRAYEIWNAEGRAEGKADEHWLAAEHEVLSLLSARSPVRKRARRANLTNAGSRFLPSP